MSQITNQNTQASHSNGVHSTAPSDQNKPLSGDSALLKALMMQLLEISTLSEAATAESAMSVALRKTMQNSVTKNIEELQQLLSFCSTCEGGSKWKQLQNFLKGKDHSWNALVKAFPNAGLSGVAPDKRADFVSRLVGLVVDPKHVSMFRTEVGTLGTTLQQYGTYQTAAKNLADSFQTGAGNLTQALSQILAQMGAIGSLMGDQLSQ